MPILFETTFSTGSELVTDDNAHRVKVKSVPQSNHVHVRGSPLHSPERIRSTNAAGLNSRTSA
jgi:hypothetical protein